MNCTQCGKSIESDRLEALPDTTICISCAKKNTNERVGFMVFNHKTAPEIVMVDSKHKEALRLAQRANARSR